MVGTDKSNAAFTQVRFMQGSNIILYIMKRASFMHKTHQCKRYLSYHPIWCTILLIILPVPTYLAFCN